MRQIDYKPKKGKLLRLDLEMDRVIKRIRISGDFFMHPEEAIDDIEHLLTGLRVDEAGEKLEKYIKENDVQLVGIRPKDIIDAIRGG
jgi:lipoate-protein ligase A